MKSYTEHSLKALLPTDPFCKVKDDLFVACASFESRSIATARSLPPGYWACQALIYVNREFLCGEPGRPTRGNMYSLVDFLARHTGSTHVVEGSWLCAQKQWESLRSSFDELIPTDAVSPAITIDVTTFNRESLLVMTLLLRMRYPSSSIRLLYAAPQTHGEWLSRGFRIVRNVIGFAGTQYPNRPTLLVVLSGFESERTLKLIEEHEPALVLLGIGDPPSRVDFLNRNEAEQKLVLARQDVRPFKFAATDLLACRSSLASLINEYGGTYNVILAPMSTKLSTLAALTVAEQFPDTQITYCLPGEYNVTDYSTGVGDIFLTEMPARIIQLAS